MARTASTPATEASGQGADPALLELVRARGYTRAETPFVLSSGGTSHDYVDLRRAVARGRDLSLAATAVIDHIARSRVDFDAIGGMTMGADPVAHVVAVLADKQWFSVRKEEKTHGSRRRVEGAAVEGVRVVLFEDTVSTGRSMLEALDVLEVEGADVVGACALLDRGDSAAAAFARRGIAYTTLLTYRDLGIAPIVAAS